MKKSKQYVIFGAGDNGRRLLNLLGTESVAFFVDNDEDKMGKNIQNIPIYSVDKLIDLSTDYLLVIGVATEYHAEIEQQLLSMGVEQYTFASDLLNKVNIDSDTRIKELHNKFQKKRCFIIGTGPSLTVADLETLKKNNEITFASNKIFKIFEQTSWRPELYCISDIDVFYFYYDIICSLELEYLFLVNMKNTKYDMLDITKLDGNNKYVFNIYKAEDYDVVKGKLMPKFSTEPYKYIIDGGITVTYSMLQWAYFLGFEEVYLLGVDFDYGDTTGLDKNGVDHFCKDYIEEGEIVNNPKLQESLKAYQVAEEFAMKHKFKIFNATRGGKLEVFERVNFDELFDIGSV